MKSIIITSLFLAILLISCNSISEEQKTQAKEFNNSIVALTYPITDDINKLLSISKQVINNAINNTFSQNDLDLFWEEYNILIENIDKNSKELKSLSEFDNEVKLKESGVKYLSDCRSILNNEYKELIELTNKPFDTEVQYRMSELLIIILEKILDTEKSTKELQKKLAEKYSFNLAKDTQDWEKVEQQIKMAKEQLKLMINYK